MSSIGLIGNRHRLRRRWSAVTAAALVLSLRHGAPTAIMGLIGGFLTPVLVGERSASAVPLLAYLALLDLALFAARLAARLDLACGGGDCC